MRSLAAAVASVHQPLQLLDRLDRGEPAARGRRRRPARSVGRARPRRRAPTARRSPRGCPTRLRPARPGRRRRGRWSPARRAGPPARRAGRPGAASSRSIAEAPPSARSAATGGRRPRPWLDHVAGLEGHGLHDRPGQVGPGGPPGDADDRAPGVGVPPRAAEAGEGGHEVRRRRCRGDRARPAARSRAALAMMPEPVAQPLHGRAGGEDGALVGVVGAGRRAATPRS